MLVSLKSPQPAGPRLYDSAQTHAPAGYAGTGGRDGEDLGEIKTSANDLATGEIACAVLSCAGVRMSPLTAAPGILVGVVAVDAEGRHRDRILSGTGSAAHRVHRSAAGMERNGAARSTRLSISTAAARVAR